MRNFIAADNAGGSVKTSGSITNPILPENLGDNPDSVGFLQRALPTAVTLLLIVGAVFFLFNLLIGGIKWISSGGDKQALESARGKISNALIGLVILFSTFAVVRFIEYFFKVSILTIDISNLIIR